MKDRIKKVRTENNLSMEKFGARIGISKASVSRLESGENNPSKQTVRLICKEFGINEAWLWTGEGEKERDSSIEFGAMCREIGVNDPKAREAIAKYFKLSPTDKELFWKFVERFLKKAED